MIRGVLLTLVAVVVSACWTLEGEDDIDDLDVPDTGTQCIQQICVPPGVPVRFGAIGRLGVGTELAVPMVVHTSLRNRVRLVASDVSLELSPGGGELVLSARKAGSFTVSARDVESEAEVARVSVQAADIASIGFTLRMAPVASIGALAGTTDQIGVVFRDLGGDELAGRAAVASDDSSIVGLAAPGWTVLDGPLERMRFGIHGVIPGTATATVTLLDGRTAALPIEVLSAPATLEVAFVEWTRLMRPAPIEGPIAVGSLAYATLVARTADDRAIAGAYGSWRATGPVMLHPATGYSSTPDVQLQPTAPGSVEVSADVGGTTVSATFEAR